MGRRECMAEEDMAEEAAMVAASEEVDTALEASGGSLSFSHRLRRRSTRRLRRPSSCRPHSRPGAEVEAREEVSRGPATGATDLFVLGIRITRRCIKNRWSF